MKSGNVLPSSIEPHAGMQIEATPAIPKILRNEARFDLLADPTQSGASFPAIS
jgi:hypothetical protein